MASELTNSLWLPPPRGGGSFFFRRAAFPGVSGRSSGAAGRGSRWYSLGGPLPGGYAGRERGRTDRGPVLCRLPASQP